MKTILAKARRGQLRSAYRVWRFSRAREAFNRAMPTEWHQLTEEQQLAEIRRAIAEVRSREGI